MDNWDYSQCLGRLKYRPKQNNCFELRQYEDRTEIRDGPIDTQELEQWLHQADSTTLPSAEGNHLIGGIRILYSYTIAGAFKDDYIPWSREDLEKIIKTLGLSPRYTQTLAAEHTIFATFPTQNTGKQTCGLSYIFATRFHFLPFWSMAASYDPATKITNALLHCEYSAGFDSIGRLKRYIKSMAGQMHPMMLPVMIIDMDTSLALGTFANAGSTLRKIEAETGHNALISGLENDSVSVDDPLALDLSSLVNRLSRCSSDVRVSEKDSEVVLEHLHLIQRDIDEAASGVPPFSAKAYEHLQSSSRQLRHHIDYLISSRKILLLRFQEVQLGAQTQLSVVHNFISQRDNKLNLSIARASRAIAVASKRDSSAMKSLALLTMVFLPGTAIASFFAMPFFNVTVDATGIETKPQFWIYWAITIPVTLLVLCLWISWLHFATKRHKKEDDEALGLDEKTNPVATSRKSG